MYTQKNLAKVKNNKRTVGLSNKTKTVGSQSNWMCEFESSAPTV